VLKTVIQQGMLARYHAWEGWRTGASAMEYGSTLTTEGTTQLEAAARRQYARRIRLVLMSATFDTGPIEDYFASIIAEHSQRVARLLADGDLSSLYIGHDPRKSTPPASTGKHAKRSKEAGSTITVATVASCLLADILQQDRPITLQVGAKRYPVTDFFLEDVYSDPRFRSLPDSEMKDINAVIRKFTGDTDRWKKSLPANRVLADAASLDDRARVSLMTVAARLALHSARPNTSDTIIIFVSGMAEIDAMVEIFSEIAPQKVVVRPSKLVGKEDEDTPQEGDLHAYDSANDEDDLEAEAALVMSMRKKTLGTAGIVQQAVVPDIAKADKPGKKPMVPAANAPAFCIFPMHSLISFDDQMAAFDSDSVDRRTRIVIATNIAESSITLPNVHTVIDLGRHKTVEYVPKIHTSVLRSTWISQASSKQRSGRAGRVMPGTCYHMYTRSFFDNVMPKYDTPEMLRLSLESVVLKTKMLGISTRMDRMGNIILDDAVTTADQDPFGSPYGAGGTTGNGDIRLVNSAKGVLLRALQAPDAANVDSALQRLATMGALSSAEDTAEVTPFGKLIHAFPGDLTLGRIVAFAAVMGCISDGIVLAACLASQDVFLTPHPVQSKTTREHLATIAKVTRGRWTFGFDPVIGRDGQMTDVACKPSYLNDVLSAIDAPAAGSGAGTGRSHDKKPGTHTVGADVTKAMLIDTLPGGRLQGLAGDPRKPFAGSATQSWSEPLTLRNVYIAWRCVHPRDRPSWCFAHGIVHRRVSAIHNAIREIGFRFAGDYPSFKPAISALLCSGGSSDDDETGGPAGGEAPVNSSWPPVDLFCQDTSILRGLLVAGSIGNLVVGLPLINKAVRESCSALALPPVSTVVFEVPAQWSKDATSRGTALEPFVAQKPAYAAVPVAPAAERTVFNGTLARSLSTFGALREQISTITPLSRKAGNRFAVLFAGDWNVPIPVWRGIRTFTEPPIDPYNPGVDAAHTRGGEAARRSPLRPCGVPEKVLRLMDVPISDGKEASTKRTFTEIASRSIALAPPVALMALSFAKNLRNEVDLPVMLPDRVPKNADGSTPADGTTIMPPRKILGASFVKAGESASSAVSKAVVLGDAANVASGGTGGQEDTSEALETVDGPAFVASYKWKLSDATAGVAFEPTGCDYDVFDDGFCGSDSDSSDYYGGDASLRRPDEKKPSGVPVHAPAMLARSSILRCAMPIAVASTKDIQRFEVNETPLLAVCGSWQLQERTVESKQGPKKTSTVTLSGTTFMWREARTTALSLLLFSRGAAVSATWAFAASRKNLTSVMDSYGHIAGGGGADAGGRHGYRGRLAAEEMEETPYLGFFTSPAGSTSFDAKDVGSTVPFIDSIRFGSGGTPIDLSDVRIYPWDLAEVNTLRRDLSMTLNNPMKAGPAAALETKDLRASVGYSSALAASIQDRILKLLGLKEGAYDPFAVAEEKMGINFPTRHGRFLVRTSLTDVDPSTPSNLLLNPYGPSDFGVEDATWAMFNTLADIASSGKRGSAGFAGTTLLDKTAIALAAADLASLARGYSRTTQTKGTITGRSGPARVSKPAAGGKYTSGHGGTYDFVFDAGYTAAPTKGLIYDSMLDNSLHRPYGVGAPKQTKMAAPATVPQHVKASNSKGKETKTHSKKPKAETSKPFIPSENKSFEQLRITFSIDDVSGTAISRHPDALRPKAPKPVAASGKPALKGKPTPGPPPAKPAAKSPRHQTNTKPPQTSGAAVGPATIPTSKQAHPKKSAKPKKGDHIDVDRI
jgi:HrpA-like RNA helicase